MKAVSPVIPGEFPPPQGKGWNSGSLWSRLGAIVIPEAYPLQPEMTSTMIFDPYRLWIILPALVMLSAAMPTLAVESPPELESRGHLPYRVVDVGDFWFLDQGDSKWCSRGVLLDPDGGGALLIASISDMGPNVNLHDGPRNSPVWQEPLPVEFSRRNCQLGVDGIWEFDPGIGPEAVFRASTEDRTRWRIERRRLEDGRLIAAFEVDGGRDRRPDGVWDGGLKVMDVEPVVAAGDTVQAMIFLTTDGHDKNRRGAFAVDAGTGAVLWEYLVGPQTRPEAAFLQDLDGDGRREIVFAGLATGNLRDTSFNGTRDDTARIFVLSPDGALVWSRACGVYPGSGCAESLDVDGDGLMEVAVGGTTSAADNNRVEVIDHRGLVLQSLDVGAGVIRLDDLGPEGDVQRLVMIQQDGRISILEMTPTSLRVARVVQSPAHVHPLGLMDCLPDPGPEILLHIGDGDFWVLGGDLKPRAVLEDSGFPRSVFGLVQVNDAAGDPYVVAQGGLGYGGGKRFALERNPRTIPWPAIVGLLAVGGSATMGWRRRRRGPSATTRRELQLQLLERLKLSNHGAIGGLSSLRRFVWNLEAVSQGFDVTRNRRGFLEGLVDEIESVHVPGLRSAIELATLARLDPAVVRTAASALGELEALLGRLDPGRLGGEKAATTAGDLSRAGEGAERAFQALRREVEREFEADPEAAIGKALEARRDDLAAAGVAATFGPPGPPSCFIDQEELAFVVDNLIENAVRAMAGGRKPELAVTWEAGPLWLTIRFRDSGCGIVPDDWQRIFEAGQSAREGGGLGLPRSREILRKYGGGLMVEESSPGGGTVMALTLPVIVPR